MHDVVVRGNSLQVKSNLMPKIEQMRRKIRDHRSRSKASRLSDVDDNYLSNMTKGGKQLMKNAPNQYNSISSGRQSKSSSRVA